MKASLSEYETRNWIFFFFAIRPTVIHQIYFSHILLEEGFLTIKAK